MLLRLLCLGFVCLSIAIYEDDTGDSVTQSIISSIDFPVDDNFSDANKLEMSSKNYDYNIYKGQEFMIKLQKSSLDNMTACIIKNITSNETKKLWPFVNSSSLPDVTYWGRGPDSRECGVRITNITGFSFLALLALENDVPLDKQSIVLRSKGVPSHGQILESSAMVNESSLLTFPLDLKGMYCSVKHPSGDEQFTLLEQGCSYNISYSSNYDAGQWSAFIGISDLISELDVRINFDVIEEMVVTSLENSPIYPGAVDLHCELTNKISDHHAKYCQFIRPTDHVGFLISEGLGNGKYSYSPNKSENVDCSMTIESPGPEDHGWWQCIIGFESSYIANLIYFSPPGDQSIYGNQEVSTDQMINVFNGSDVSLSCNANISLLYCFIVAPNGSLYIGDQNLLGVGTCLVVVESVNEKQSGIWSCQMGPANGGTEILQNIILTVTTSSMIPVNEDVTGAVGSWVILQCQAVPYSSNNMTPLRSSLSYCRFRHPKNMSITLDDKSHPQVDQRYHYYGTGLQDGVCGILIDPVSILDAGKWTCTGAVDGKSTESSANITLHITESTEVFPGSALVEPYGEVVLQMKGRRDDQESCSIEMPNGSVIILNSTEGCPVSYWGKGIKEGYCGVKICSEALQHPTHGYQMWTLVSNNSQSISVRAVAWVGVTDVEIRRMDERLVVELGKTAVLNCNMEGSVYCLIVRPGDLPDHYNPGPCIKTLNVSSVDIGNWTCYIGLPTTTFEKVKTIELIARVTTLVARGKKTALSMELLCTVDYPLEYCRFMDPHKSSFLLRDGFVIDRLSYKGRGLDQGDCGVSISSVDNQDYDVWMCYAGVKRDGIVEHQVGYIDFRKDEVKSTSTEIVSRKGIMAVLGTELTVECQLSASLSYCWLLHPNGTQLIATPSSKTDLQLGLCRIIIPKAYMTDAGRWICHMGTSESDGKELETQIDVEIKNSALYPAESTVIVSGSENSTIIMCYTVPQGAELDYCRFLRPDGRGFYLNQHISGAVFDRYQYHGQGIDKGQCGLLIERLQSEDYGQWVCAGMLHGTFKEATSPFIVKQKGSFSKDDMDWIIPTVITAVVITAVGITTFYIIRRRKLSKAILVPSIPVEPRVSDTSSELSIFSVDQIGQPQDESVQNFES